MKYAIIGSGKIGTALARTFACKNIEVAIANKGCAPLHVPGGQPGGLIFQNLAKLG